MKKNPKPIKKEKRKPREEEYRTAEEEVRGRKIVCTCREDPAWCEKHGGF